MFTWTGVLDRGGYLRQSAIFVVVLIGTVLFFPFILKAIVSSFRCSMDTCGALSLVVSMALRPALFLATMALGLSACIRRARDAGLPAWAGAFPIVMLAASQDFLQYAGASWAYAFSSGVFMRTPFHALFGIVLVGLLAIPERGALRSGENRVLDWALVILAGWLTLGAVPRLLNILVVTPSLLSIGKVFYVFAHFALYQMLLFTALAAFRIWLSRFSSTGGPDRAPRPYRARQAAPAGPSLWRLKPAALVGFVVTLAVLIYSLRASGSISLSFSQWSSVILAVVLALPTILPSFLMYTALTATGLRLVAKQDLIAVIAFLISLVPFGLWIQSSLSISAAQAEERAKIAAIPKTTLPAKIDAVVIEGDNWSLINCARRLIASGDYDVGDVLTRGQGRGGGYLRYTKATANGAVDKGISAESVPSDHVLIRFSRNPKLAPKTGRSADITAPPVEISTVDPNGERLVAFTYKAFNPTPHFPPMLTSVGWFHGNSGVTSQTQCKSTDAFIQRELLDKLPRRST